ncbi:MAG: hypothetical protein QOD29_2413 [Alphaproteobacteria bacterium]|jgi:hypothetical protein|nr:hypothetical protein [Alphaproteobacteria bacterium]
MAKGSSRKTPSAPALKVIPGGKGAPRERTRQEKEVSGRAASRGKRVQFDLETWHALNLLARDRMMTFQELADEAFRDLLRKHGRPTDLKDALRRSLKNAEPRSPRQQRKTKPRDDEH